MISIVMLGVGSEAEATLASWQAEAERQGQQSEALLLEPTSENPFKSVLSKAIRDAQGEVLLFVAPGIKPQSKSVSDCLQAIQGGAIGGGFWSIADHPQSLLTRAKGAMSAFLRGILKRTDGTVVFCSLKVARSLSGVPEAISDWPSFVSALQKKGRFVVPRSPVLRSTPVDLLGGFEAPGGEDAQTWFKKFLEAFGWMLFWLFLTFLVNGFNTPRFLPTESELERVRWFQQTFLKWADPGCCFPPVEILRGALLGMIILPWGISLLISAGVIPVLCLMRPKREFSQSFVISLGDFMFTRGIYVIALYLAYPTLAYGAIAPTTPPPDGDLSWTRFYWGPVMLLAIGLYIRFIAHTVLAGKDIFEQSEKSEKKSGRGLRP